MTVYDHACVCQQDQRNEIGNHQEDPQCNRKEGKIARVSNGAINPFRLQLWGFTQSESGLNRFAHRYCEQNVQQKSKTHHNDRDELSWNAIEER